MDLVITRITGQKKCNDDQHFDFCPRVVRIWREGNYPKFVERAIADKCIDYDMPGRAVITVLEEEIRFEMVEVCTPFKFEFVFWCADVVAGPRTVIPGGKLVFPVQFGTPRADRHEFLFTAQNVHNQHDKTVAINVEFRVE